MLALVVAASTATGSGVRTATAAGAPPAVASGDRRERIWRSYDLASPYGADQRRRTSRDDLAQRVADVPALALDATDRLDVVESYWEQWTALERLRQRWARWAALAPEADRAHSHARIAALEAELASVLEQTETPGALAEPVAQLRRAYNEEREHLARRVGVVAGADLVPAPRTRVSACVRGTDRPDPAPHLDAKHPAAPERRPARLVPQPGLARVYPEAAYQAWGNVRLRVQVDIAGCVRDASVIGSSGLATLDAAALVWTDTAHFVPATAAGRAAPAAVVVDVQFRHGVDAIEDDLPAGMARSQSSSQQASIRTLGGVTIGNSRRTVRAVKGPPLRDRGSSWLYNSIDSAHDGVLTITFGQQMDDELDPVLRIEYSGDADSAPPELPRLSGKRLEDLVRLYGEPVWRNDPDPRHAWMMFADNLSVLLTDGRVASYAANEPQLESQRSNVRVYVEDGVER